MELRARGKFPKPAKKASNSFICFSVAWVGGGSRVMVSLCPAEDSGREDPMAVVQDRVPRSWQQVRDRVERREQGQAASCL